MAESVIIPTADGRRLRAIYARRAYDEVLTRHQLDVLKHKGLGGEFLPKEAAALVFHAKYAPHVTRIGITPLSPQLPEPPKIDHFRIRIPKWPDVTITHYLLYFSHVLEVPRPPKYGYFDTLNQP